MKFVFKLCSCFRAVTAIPFSLFFPVIPWLLQLILFAWFVSVLAYPFSIEIASTTPLQFICLVPTYMLIQLAKKYHFCLYLVKPGTEIILRFSRQRNSF